MGVGNPPRMQEGPPKNWETYQGHSFREGSHLLVSAIPVSWYMYPWWLGPYVTLRPSSSRICLFHVIYFSLDPYRACMYEPLEKSMMTFFHSVTPCKPSSHVYSFSCMWGLSITTATSNVMDLRLRMDLMLNGVALHAQCNYELWNEVNVSRYASKLSACNTNSNSQGAMVELWNCPGEPKSWDWSRGI